MAGARVDGALKVGAGAAVEVGVLEDGTLGGVSAAGREGETVEEVSKEIASAALRSARGNSGVILSLFFRGVSRAFKEIARADVPDVARALRVRARAGQL